MICKRIELDYCLLRVEHTSRKQRKIPIDNYLKPLKLNFNKVDEIKSRDDTFTVIGNSGGHGLQASSGKGLNILQDSFPRLLITYATVLQGNSGGPLFNQNYEVVGIVISESRNKHSDKSFTASASLYYILEHIYQRKPELYKQLKDWDIVPYTMQLF